MLLTGIGNKVSRLQTFLYMSIIEEICLSCFLECYVEVVLNESKFGPIIEDKKKIQCKFLES
jgi:hypothetical protein